MTPNHCSPEPVALADKLTAMAHGLFSAAEAGLLLEAAKALRAGVAQSIVPDPPLAKLLREVDPGLAEVLADNAAYVRVIRNNVIEECAKLVERSGLRNPENIARDIRALTSVSSTPRGMCHDHPTKRCTPDDCCQPLTSKQCGEP